MKTTKKSKISSLLLFTFFFLFSFFWEVSLSFSQHTDYDLKSVTDLDSLYLGWLDDPDTLFVKPDNSYSESEKDSIQKAMDRWNGTGHKPFLRMWKANDPVVHISFCTDPALKSAGLCSIEFEKIYDKEAYTSAKISRKPGTTIGLTELATHEMGHALGLNDTDETANPTDVMKAEGINGTNGNLSKHDSSEIQVADATYIKDKLKKAASPDTAALVGSSVTVTFDLAETYPPAVANQAVILVSPEFNMFIYPSAPAYIVGNKLWSELTLDPLHWSGSWYVYYGIDLPNPYQDFYFIGWHYAHIDPVPPTFFNVYFDITHSREGITVDWTTSYPYQTPLRAVLYVDDTIKYLAKGGGPIVLDLEQGTHELTLYLDDYKNNFSSATTNIYVGQQEIDGEKGFLSIYPNPSCDVCNISCSEVSDIMIYDLQGRIVWGTRGKTVTWVPSPGTSPGLYIVRADSPDYSGVLRFLYQPR